jgi:hypothetical protein
MNATSRCIQTRARACNAESKKPRRESSETLDWATIRCPVGFAVTGTVVAAGGTAGNCFAIDSDEETVTATSFFRLVRSLLDRDAADFKLATFPVVTRLVAIRLEGFLLAVFEEARASVGTRVGFRPTSDLGFRGFIRRPDAMEELRWDLDFREPRTAVVAMLKLLVRGR